MTSTDNSTNLVASCSTRAHGTISHRRRVLFDKAHKQYVCQDNQGNMLWETKADGTKREMFVTKKLFGLVKHRYFELDREETDNTIENVGRIFIHTQCYGTTGILTNGLNYIALSNDTVQAAESAGTATVLSNEITTNGLARAQGTVTLPITNGLQTVIVYTWTANNTQSAQKSALFNLASAGVINHVLPFTQRNLVATDQLLLTYTITTS